MKICARLFFLILGVGSVMTAALPGRINEELSKGAGEGIAAQIFLKSNKKKFKCGNRDILQPSNSKKRKKRYIPRGLSWHKKVITWRLENNTPHLPMTVTQYLTQRAFDQWQMHSGLQFYQLDHGTADIMISFQQMFHYAQGNELCAFAFDGPGGTIGHAFYPSSDYAYAGNIHLDIEEVFTSDGNNGVNFGAVILHEIGHSLGLLHSNTWYSIMHPDFATSAKGENIQVTLDDIYGIQSIYGYPTKDQSVMRRADYRSNEGVKLNNPGEIRQRTSSTIPVSKPESSSRLPTTTPNAPIQIAASSQSRSTRFIDNNVEIRNEAETEKQRNSIDDTSATMLKPKLKSTTSRPAVSRMRKNSKWAILKKKSTKALEHQVSTTTTSGYILSRTTESNTDAVSMETSTIAATTTTATTTPATTTASPSTTLPATTTISNEIPEFSINKPACPPTINAIFVSRFSDKTYVFNGAFTYPLGSRLGYDEASTFLTQHRYNFKTVDAVYRSTRSKKLIVFSNKKYAVFDDEVDQERIGSIYDFGFPSYIKKVDAALIYGPYKNTYFFTGKYYWRYNERKGRMDPGYPKKIRSIWKGVPANVDSAVTWKNQVAYFFKGKYYYRINSRTASVEPGYPKLINQIWTRC